jgi:hypothetical protein
MIKGRLFVLFFIFIALSTGFHIFMGEGDRNLLVIAILFLMPFFMLGHFPSFRKDEIVLYGLCISLLLSSIINFESFRISTVIYSILFIIAFVYVKRVIAYQAIPPALIEKMIRWLIYAHFIVLLVQQISVFSGSTFVLNQINVWPVSKYKLNGLSPEPSHTARILVLLMFFYIKIREVEFSRNYHLIKDFFRDKFVWISFLYVMLSMGSGAAFFFLPFFFAQFLNTRTLFQTGSFLFIIFLVMLSVEFVPVVRAVVFAKAAISFQPEAMLLADHSASMRVVPFFVYLDNFDFQNWRTWFGWGVDYNIILLPKYIPGVAQGVNIGGVVPNFFLNYGLISGFLLICSMRKFVFHSFFSYEFLLWIIMISSVPLNSQIFWLATIVFMWTRMLHSKERS